MLESASRSDQPAVASVRRTPQELIELKDPPELLELHERLTTIENFPTVPEAIELINALIFRKIPVVSEFDLAFLNGTLREGMEYCPQRALIAALIENDRSRADQIYDEIAAGADGEANVAEMMHLACWGNNKGFSYAAEILLYDYLIQRNPDVVFMNSPRGGTMLHSWLNGNYYLVIFRDLLERGVDPRNLGGLTRPVLSYLDDCLDHIRSRIPAFAADESYLRVSAAHRMVRATLNI